MRASNFSRMLLIKCAWLSAGLGVYKIGKEFVQDGYLSLVGSIFLLNSLWCFYLIGKMEVKTNDKTVPTDSIPQ